MSSKKKRSALLRTRRETSANNRETYKHDRETLKINRETPKHLRSIQQRRLRRTSLLFAIAVLALLVSVWQTKEIQQASLEIPQFSGEAYMREVLVSSEETETSEEAADSKEAETNEVLSASEEAGSNKGAVSADSVLSPTSLGLVASDTEIPSWVASELFDVSSESSLRALSDWSVVSFERTGEVSCIQEELQSKLQDGGWQLVESGIEGTVTGIKESGVCQWIALSCIEAAGVVCVVMQCAVAL